MRPHHWCGPARPDLGGRWPSRLVATALRGRVNTEPRWGADFSERVSPPHCSAAPPPGDGRTNGVSEDKSDNEPDCEDDCRIDCSHSCKSLHVLSGFRSTKTRAFPAPDCLDGRGGHIGHKNRKPSATRRPFSEIPGGAAPTCRRSPVGKSRR
jgi:hypothetical protein